MKKKVLFQNYLWRILHYFFKMAVPLFINFYGAKVLLPEKFGKIVFLLTAMSLVSLFSNFGISMATSKYAAEKASKLEYGDLKKLFISTSIISIALTPILLIAFFAFLWRDNGFLLFYCIPYLIFAPLTSILDGLYVGVQRFKSLALYTLVPSTISLVLGFFLIKNYGDKGMILCYSANYTLLFLVYFLGFPYKSNKIDKRLAIEVFKYAAIIGLGSMAYFLYSRADILVLKQNHYIKEIGYYEMIMRAFELILAPIVLAAQVSAPYFINLKAKKDIDKLRHYINISTISSFGMGVAIALIGYFLFPYLLKSFYPHYYNENFLIILNILLNTTPLKFFGTFFTGAILTPLGFAKIGSSIVFIFGILNIALDIVLVKRFGFVGVFYSTLIVHNLNIIIQYGLYRVYSKKIYNEARNLQVD